MKPSFSDIDLYPVISTSGENPEEPVRILRELLKTDIKVVQLREKKQTKTERARLAEVFRKMTLAKNVLLIINDDIDIALDSSADGVHLGNDDMPLKEARKLAPNLIIGKSCHSVEEALAAEAEGASYINIGPIFKTPTKEGMNPVGLDLISEVKKITSLPFTVMGGIDKNNLKDVVSAGAKRVAMVRGFIGKDIPKKTAELYQVYRTALKEYLLKGETS
ncbi:MAG: thiamine phosphate synthase [Elusimicrobia bacterium]|nr:thiamine phosphate synthase [Elusimicrobiota bacterium]